MDMTKRARQRAFWWLLIVAWTVLGIVMTVMGEYLFGGVSFAIAVFYVGLEIWLWRREKRFRQAMAEMSKDEDVPTG